MEEEPQQEHQEEQAIQIPPLRSLQSEEKVYLKFVNFIRSCVEIVWINFTGHLVRYQILRYGASLDINTYKSHPWIALDVHSRDRMLVDGKFVFMPKTTREYLEDNRDPNIIYPVVPPERRWIVKITLPLYSLRYRALLEVRNIYKTVEAVEELELPQGLLDDLKRVIKVRGTIVFNH